MPARAACAPLPMLLPRQLMIALIHPRRDPHDPLGRRTATPRPVDQPPKQAPGPRGRRLTLVLLDFLQLMADL